MVKGREHERIVRTWHALAQHQSTIYSNSRLGPGAMCCLPKVVLEHAVTAPEGFDLESYKESLGWSTLISGWYR